MPKKKNQQTVIEKDSPEYFMNAIEHTDWSVAKAKKNGDKLMLSRKVAEIGKCLCELAHECEYSAYYLEQAMRDGAGDSMMPATLGDECSSMKEKAEAYKGVAFKYKQKFGVHPTEAYSAFGKKWEPSDHKTRYESETGGKMVTKKMSVFESITEIEADALLAEMHRAEASKVKAMSFVDGKEVRYQDDEPEDGVWKRYTGPRGGKGWVRVGNATDGGGATKSPDRIQSMKEKIDGYHAMAADGNMSEGELSDAVNDLIGRSDGPNADIYHELHDYKEESYAKVYLATLKWNQDAKGEPMPWLGEGNEPKEDEPKPVAFREGRRVSSVDGMVGFIVVTAGEFNGMHVDPFGGMAEMLPDFESPEFDSWIVPADQADYYVARINREFNPVAVVAVPANELISF